MLRDAESRADPTEEYDRIAVVVAAAVLLLLPAVEDFASVWAGLAGALVGGRLRPRRRALGRAVSKFTRLSDELHDYMVDHGARQDEVLRRVQEETAAMGRIANMQIAPDQGAFLTLLCQRSAPARRSSSAPSPATRRSASPAGWRRAAG